MKYLFKDLIVCDRCGKNYNPKNNNGTINYVCQTRKNRGKSYCNSQILKEDFLMQLVERNRKVNKEEFDVSKIREIIKIIKINGDNIGIEFIDGTELTISDNIIKF